MMGLSGVGLAHAADTSQPGASSPTLARVFAAWKAREERVKSFRFTWEYRLSFPKEYAFPDVPVVGGLKARGIRFNFAGVHYTMPRSDIWVAGTDRFRDEFSIVACGGAYEWKLTGECSVTINGSKHTRFNKPIGLDELPQVATWNEIDAAPSGDAQLVARSDDLAPLLLTFRPFHPAFGWNRDRCRLVSESEFVGATPCLVIQMDEISKSERCWIDPNRDYAILKWEKRPLRLPRVSIRIDHQHDPVHGWLPIRWNRQLPGLNPDATGTAEGVVTKYTVNKTLPKETFEPVFPAGTSVTDLAAEASVPRDKKAKKSKPRNPVYDPFAEPLKDLDGALKIAREQNKRVLIDFGANWCGDCHALAGVFHDNVDVSVALKTGFVLVLVDVENDTGRQLYKRCAPGRKTMGIPHLAVLDPNGDLVASEMSEFAVGKYDIAKLEAFIAKWSPSR
jgi:thiol-disulfide isomerase/thioredoxin